MRTVIYPETSSAISSITLFPQDKIMGIEYKSSRKSYNYVIRDYSAIHDLISCQIVGASFGKCVSSLIKENKIVHS